MNVSYDYYRIFYYVARYGSITQAAKMLLASQPNLTRAIKNLEAQLGCTLFVRNNRGIRLTPEGERLYEHVAIAHENMEAAEQELTGSRTLERGTVCVAASEIALHLVLLPVLKAYRALHPGIRFRIGNYLTAQAVDALKNGMADIAVVTTPTPLSATTEEIVVRPFREVAVCSRAYTDLASRRVGFAELLRYPMISLGTQTRSYELYSRFFAEHGLRYQPETEAATADQILPMVRADLGVGFVPPEFIAGAPDILTIETEELLPGRQIRIVKRKEQPLSMAAKELERLLLSPIQTGN